MTDLQKSQIETCALMVRTYKREVKAAFDARLIADEKLGKSQRELQVAETRLMRLVEDLVEI